MVRLELRFAFHTMTGSLAYEEQCTCPDCRHLRVDPRLSRQRLTPEGYDNPVQLS